jgi:hypothetical protein
MGGLQGLASPFTAWIVASYASAATSIALLGPTSAKAQIVVDTAQAYASESAETIQGESIAVATSSSPAVALSSICTDRPTKSNFACTVDDGHFQYESDLVNGSLLRQGGLTTDTYLVVNPTFKYGLTSNIDIETNFSPAEIVHTQESGGAERTIAGVSDLYFRLKYEFLKIGSGILQATLLPYVKAPTARPSIGDGVVEGGVILPVNYKLTDTLTLTIDPEVDFYKDSAGGGRHVNTAQLVNLAISLPRNFTLYGELWGDWNFNTIGTVRQYSADTAITYGFTPYLQLDAGVNIGLNRYTPRTQAYVGVSQKF